MLIDHKREMISEFENLTQQHRQGLQKSEQLLEEDLELFNKFLEDNKNNSRAAIKAAEDETKMKQDRINKIKELLEFKADLLTKNNQKIELLEDYLGYKTFLDKITPKEELEKIERNKVERKTSCKSKSEKGTFHFKRSQN